MTNRWLILFVLFFARLSMAFQFQSVASLSPLILENYALNLADIGLLIGLYLAPGMVVAIPGGTIAGRFGDKRIVTLSLVLMLLGGILVAYGTGWESLMFGRVLAGIGGVALNVVMTKMVVDWFVDKEISTAMAIFVNSWPVGIALALFSLPGIAAFGGLQMAWFTVLALIFAGLVLFLLVYRPRENASVQVDIKITKFPVLALFLAGIVWAFYNAALAMIFSFGPALLTGRGLPLTTASSITSIFIFIAAISVPVGGILADRTGRGVTVIMISLIGYALLIPLALSVPSGMILAVLILAGLIFGLGAGPIVALPSQVLPPQSRAFAMGVYYTLYYATMMGATSLAGTMADWSGNIDSIFIFGVALSVGAMLALMGYRQVARRHMNPT